MPKCECHGETMGWSKDPRVKSGDGYWHCRVKKRIYEASEKGRAKNARYRGTSRARENSRARSARYARTDHGREHIALYLQNRSGLQEQTYRMNAWFKASAKRIERLDRELNG